MKTLFLGASHVTDLNLYAIATGLETSFDSYIGVGGSTIIAALLACKMDPDVSKYLLKSLRLVANEYGWNEKNCNAMLQSPLPRGNGIIYKKVLGKVFGDRLLSSVPLGVIAYNVTRRRVELLRGKNLTIVEAIMIATSLPGYFYPTYYEKEQYIDCTPVNRFPIDIVPADEDVFSIYVRSSSSTFAEEVLSAASKPWQDIVPSMVIDDSETNL